MKNRYPMEWGELFTLLLIPLFIGKALDGSWFAIVVIATILFGMVFRVCLLLNSYRHFEHERIQIAGGRLTVREYFYCIIPGKVKLDISLSDIASCRLCHMTDPYFDMSSTSLQISKQQDIASESYPQTVFNIRGNHDAATEVFSLMKSLFPETIRIDDDFVLDMSRGKLATNQ